jgi:hypothetical protein
VPGTAFVPIAFAPYFTGRPRILLRAPDPRSGGSRNKPTAYLRLKLVARQFEFKINVLSRLDAFQ